MSQEKIIVREGQLEDLQALANIYFNTIHQVNSQHYTEEQINAWAPKSSLELALWREKFEKIRPVVAMIGGVVVGFAEFEPNGHIDCFYCHHQYIGFGVGKALMKAIHEKANQNNIKRIFVEVSITARPFFEKQGFSVVEEQTVVIHGVKLTNYRMEKNLP